jgi:hypothetical protein
MAVTVTSAAPQALDALHKCRWVRVLLPDKYAMSPLVLSAGCSNGILLATLASGLPARGKTQKKLPARGP